MTARTTIITFAIVCASISLWLGSAAWGFIPNADRIAGAIAQANAAAGRSQALRFELTMRIGDGDVLATGQLVSHPSGLARLELRGAKDLVERHLLQGTEHSATRNGRPLSGAREFLPPLFFAQATSATSLQAALLAFGVDPGPVGLAPCGESDCYVIGDPSREAPRPGAATGATAASPDGGPPSADSEEPDGWGFGFGEGPESDLILEGGGHPPTIWVESATYRIVKFELSSGVKIELGPPVVRDGLEAPSWLVIFEPDREPVYFEFQRVTAVNAPARAFSRFWLANGESPEQELP